MSLVQSAMFNHHMGPSHTRSRSFELFQEAKTLRVAACKRSYSDDLNISTKRARTAPPSPPYETATPTRASRLVISNLVKPTSNLRSRSLSPNKKFSSPLSPSSSPIATVTSPISSPQNIKIKLPSISDALNLPPITSKEPVKLKPIVPTVSLDYFDTYKPNDENWRYGLLDKIAKESKHFHLNQYNYLNDHAKPSFDSKLSSKIQQLSIANGKKINFPYESNYTYLNKTYLNDVKNYPEYLELAAESLLQLKERQLPHLHYSCTKNNTHHHHHTCQCKDFCLFQHLRFHIFLLLTPHHKPQHFTTHLHNNNSNRLRHHKRYIINNHSHLFLHTNSFQYHLHLLKNLDRIY